MRTQRAPIPGCIGATEDTAMRRVAAAGTRRTLPDDPLIRADDLFQEALEVGAVELRQGPLVLLHAPLPEVEVDVGDAVLDRRPERPPVLRHQPPQARPGDLVSQPPAVVVRDELVELAG